MKELSFAEQLCYITTRIEAVDINGEEQIGTGFFIGFKLAEEGKQVPLLVTNKHILDGAKSIKIHLNEKDIEGNPIDNSVVDVELTPYNSFFINHPDASVDLSVFPINMAISQIELQLSKKLYYKTFPREIITTDEKAEEFDAVEDILMIGYPVGIWDSKNNRPIFRKGITATDPKVDYEGERTFMIDCACINGSSGSPVLIFNKGIYSNKFAQETCYDSLRALLIGIQSSIPIYDVEGEIVKIKTPTAKRSSVPVVGLPINLGCIIKAQCIFDFLPLLEKKLNVKFANA